MRRFFVVLCALTLGAMAFAQYDPTTGESTIYNSAIGFGFRIGAFFPTDGSLRNKSNTWSDPAIEYDFQRSLFKAGVTYASADWIASKFFGGEHLLAIAVNQRFYTKNKRYSIGGTPYFFLGAGAGWQDNNGNQSTTWLARGGVGAEFEGNYFVEAAAIVSPKLNGVNPSGISVSFGYRFK